MSQLPCRNCDELYDCKDHDSCPHCNFPTQISLNPIPTHAELAQALRFITLDLEDGKFA